MAAAEHRLQAEGGHRADRAGRAQHGVGELEEGVAPAREARPKLRSELDQRTPASLSGALVRSASVDSCPIVLLLSDPEAGILATEERHGHQGTPPDRLADLRAPLPRTGPPAGRRRLHRRRAASPPATTDAANPAAAATPTRPVSTAPTANGPPRSTARPSTGGSPNEKPTLYSEWIANDRRVRAIIAQMREVAAKAQQLMLEQAASEAS